MNWKYLLLLFTFVSCGSADTEDEDWELSNEQKEYWFAGDAEIASYKLSQARYGELREGSAVMIFVSEPFSTQSWSKADRPGEGDFQVLKLNLTKDFNTGIYPYSLMLSTFMPFREPKHAVKVTASSQEWCGHSFMELRNRKKFDINISSYFQGESGMKNLDKNWLEDDIWSLIRLSPESLPTGKFSMIPSFMYLRLSHAETKSYAAAGNKSESDGIATYTLQYPELDRSLSIKYENTFPFKIISWEESYFSGWGDKRQRLTTSGERIKSIKIDYWNKNSNADEALRSQLGLE